MVITQQPMGGFLQSMVPFISPVHELSRKVQIQGSRSIHVEKMCVEHGNRRRKCAEIGVLFNHHFHKTKATTRRPISEFVRVMVLKYSTVNDLFRERLSQKF